MCRLPCDYFLSIFNKDITEILKNALTSEISPHLHRRKGYDTTWIGGLIYKIQKLHNYDKHLWIIIYTYLTEIQFFVAICRTERNNCRCI